jgi:WD40 repeat protein
VWDATTSQETLTLQGHTSSVTSVAFSPDGKRIVSGSLDQTLKVWDATSGQETLTHKGHTASVNSVGFSPDGKRILSGSHDNPVKVCDAIGSRQNPVAWFTRFGLIDQSTEKGTGENGTNGRRPTTGTCAFV